MIAGGELNNREWASLVWLAVAVAAALWWKPTRPVVLGLGPLVRTAAISLIGVLVAGLWLWSAGIAFVFAQIHLWTPDLLKDTVIWAIGPAFVLVFRVPQVPKDPHFFRRAVLETVKLSVLVEFYVNLHVLSFVQELMLIPAVTFVALIAQGARTQPKYRQVRQVFDFLLVVMGVALLAYVTITLATNWRQEDPWRDTRQLALPIWLTVGAVPYIYIVCLCVNYEGAYKRIAFRWNKDAPSSKDFAAVRRAMLALLIELNVRTHLVGSFYEPWVARLTETHNLSEARSVVRGFRRGE